MVSTNNIVKSFFIFLLIASGIIFASSPTISNCNTIINAPGIYVLNQSLILNNSNYIDGIFPYGSYGACLVINSSNVNLNCDDYSIIGQGTSATSIAILAENTSTSPLSGIAISNCSINNISVGIIYQSIQNSNVSSSIISNGSATLAPSQIDAGIYLSNSSNVSVQDISVSNYSYSNASGLWDSLGFNNSFSSSDLSNIVLSGIKFQSSTSDTLSTSTINDSGIGILSGDGSNNSISNTTTNSNLIGIETSNFDNGLTVNGSYIFQNSIDGLNITAPLSITGGWLYGNGNDFDVSPESNPYNLSITNVTLFGTDGNMSANFTELSLFDQVVSGEPFKLTWSANVSPAPFGYQNFQNNSLKITSTNGVLNLTSLLWNSTQASSYNQSLFRLALFNSSGNNWYLLNNSPNTTGQSLSKSNLNVSSLNPFYLSLLQLSSIGVTQSTSGSLIIDSPFTFIDEVTNPSASNITVTLNDTFDPSFVYVSGSVNVTNSTPITANSILWSNLSIPADSSIYISYQVTPTSTGTFYSNLSANSTSFFNEAMITNTTSSTTISNPAPPPSSGGNQNQPYVPPTLATFSIAASVSCPDDQLLVTVKDGSTPLSGVSINIQGQSPSTFIGTITTDSTGSARTSILGYTGPAELDASLSGYSGQKTTIQVPFCQASECKYDSDCPDSDSCVQYQCVPVSCSCGVVSNHECTAYACCSDSDCGTGLSCTGHACVPTNPNSQQNSQSSGQSVSCTTNSDCSGNQSCSGGYCTALTGQCGYASNHIFTSYQCGDEPGCSLCPSGSICSSHTCISLNITGPTNGSLGDSVTFHATENNASCEQCTVQVQDPNGGLQTLQTDANGDISFPLNYLGQYQVSLVQNNTPVQSVGITSSTSNGSNNSNQNLLTVILAGGAVTGSLLVLIVILVLAYLYFRSRRSSKKTKDTDQDED